MSLYCCNETTRWDVWLAQTAADPAEPSLDPRWKHRQALRLGLNTERWPVWCGISLDGSVTAGGGLGYIVTNSQLETYLWVEDDDFSMPKVAVRWRTDGAESISSAFGQLLPNDADDIAEGLAGFTAACVDAKAWEWTGASWSEILDYHNPASMLPLPFENYVPSSVVCLSPPFRAWTPHVVTDRDPLFPFELDLAEVLAAAEIEVEVDGPGAGTFTLTPSSDVEYPDSRLRRVIFGGSAALIMDFSMCDGDAAKAAAVSLFTAVGAAVGFDQFGYGSTSGTRYASETWAFWQFDIGAWTPEITTSAVNAGPDDGPLRGHLYTGAPFWRPTGRSVIRVEAV